MGFELVGVRLWGSSGILWDIVGYCGIRYFLVGLVCCLCVVYIDNTIGVNYEDVLRDDGLIVAILLSEIRRGCFVCPAFDITISLLVTIRAGGISDIVIRRHAQHLNVCR